MKPFVANRVGKIKSTTEPYQWRYIPTDLNPADLLTRGVTISKLKTEEKWWKGPPFLVCGRSETKVIRNEESKEFRKQYVKHAEKQNSIDASTLVTREA